jgi:hypothetical protein
VTVALLTLTRSSREPRSCRRLRCSPSNSVRPLPTSPRPSTPPSGRSPPTTCSFDVHLSQAPDPRLRRATCLGPALGFVRHSFRRATSAPKGFGFASHPACPATSAAVVSGPSARRPTPRPRLHGSCCSTTASPAPLELGKPRRVSLTAPKAARFVRPPCQAPAPQTRRSASRAPFQAAWRLAAALTRTASPEGESARAPATSIAPLLGRPRSRGTRRSPVRTTASSLRPAPHPGLPRNPRVPLQPPSSMPGGPWSAPPPRQPEGRRLGNPVVRTAPRPRTVARGRPEGLSRTPAASASSSRLVGRTSSDFNEQLRQRRSRRLCSKQVRLQGLAPSESPLPPCGGLDRAAPDALLDFQPFRDFS